MITRRAYIYNLFVLLYTKVKVCNNNFKKLKYFFTKINFFLLINTFSDRFTINIQNSPFDIFLN